MVPRGDEDKGETSYEVEGMEGSASAAGAFPKASG